MKTGTNLFIAFLLLNLLIAGCDCSKTPPPPNPPTRDTQPPVASISLSSVGETSATFTFSATDNVAVTSLSLYVLSAQNVLGQSSTTVSSLVPNTSYNAILTAKDAAGNTGLAQVAFKTSAHPSTWFATPTISNMVPISGMIGNTISNEFTITLNNNSGSTKTATFSLDFGNIYIKMLRYQAANSPQGTGWNVLQTAAPFGSTVTFSNFSLPPGATTLKAVFARRITQGQDGSAINLSFTSLDDGEGGSAPQGGYQAPVPAGTVDGNTTPTQFITEWWGYMDQSPIYLSPGGTGTSSNYNVTGVKVSGPAPARVVSLRLRNPYGNALIWKPGTWRASFVGPDILANESWNGDYVKLTLANGSDIPNNAMGTFLIYCQIQNASSTQSFNSHTMTPGLFGLELKTKFDIQVANSSGQLIDLSEVVVKQGSTVIAN